jgi:hypothetical protein
VCVCFQHTRFCSRRGAPPPGLTWKKADDAYINACALKQHTLCDPVLDQRVAGEQEDTKSDEVGEGGQGGTPSAAPSSKPDRPGNTGAAHKDYGRNRPPIALNKQEADNRPVIVSKIGWDKVDMQYRDLFEARLTCDARSIETRLHQKFHHLPLGTHPLVLLHDVQNQIHTYQSN